MLLCLSANHRTASFPVLEKLAAREDGELESALRDAPGVDGAIVLATCNRFEIYLDIDTAQPVTPELMPTIASALDVSVETLRANMSVIHDTQVPEYLFAVSSGLESVVVGEGEISGQVRRALEESRAAGMSTSQLERLFQSASTTSRGIKSGTKLQSAGRSLVRLSLELAASQIADWSTAQVVLVGTGSYAAASLKALQDRGVTRVGVYSPSGRAHKFAERDGVFVIERENLPEHLSNADLVVTCSTADTVVIDYDLVLGARLAPGCAESTLFIDLGMPRNVDPAVGRLNGVSVLDLETIRIHAPLEELGAADEARCIVSRAASEFVEQQAETSVAEGIAALRSHITDIARAETARVANKDDAGVAEAALRRLANTLLHSPSVRAKELARAGRGDEYLDAIELLFGITVERSARENEAEPRVDSLPALPGEHDHASTRPSDASAEDNVPGCPAHTP